MALLIIVSAVAAWLVLSLPVAVIIGRISHRADTSSRHRLASTFGSHRITAGASRMAATGTGAIGGITR